ncbi:MAG: hypothetical protein H6606_09590 [Flavobacteriales bacterium]|nr:hypothetical protein [Flavobacteriales bacterium]
MTKPNTETALIPELNLSYNSLRQTLGYLGLTLPFLLLAGNEFRAQSSLSHYYYTQMSVVFTGVLVAFGVFLITYRGYEKTKAKGEYLSDNVICNIGGFLIIATALIPTSYGEDFGIPPAANGHNNDLAGWIHLVCASGFFICMAWMSYFKFTLGSGDELYKRRRKRLYRVCGLGVMLSLLAMGLGVFLDYDITGIDIYLGETLALLFFGTSWLVKGEALKNIGM